MQECPDAGTVEIDAGLPADGLFFHKNHCGIHTVYC